MTNEDATELAATVSPEVAYLAQLTRDELSPGSFHVSAKAWGGVLDRLDQRLARRRRTLRLAFTGTCLAAIIPLAVLALRAPQGEKPLQVSFTGAQLGDHGQITRTASLPNASLLHFSAPKSSSAPMRPPISSTSPPAAPPWHWNTVLPNSA